VRLELPTPGRSRMPASVVPEAGVGPFVPQAHEGVAPIGGALDLGQPVAVLGAPGAAILGQPLAKGNAWLPLDWVDAFGPQLVGRGDQRIR
jgi:hypothetical protein